MAAHFKSSGYAPGSNKRSKRSVLSEVDDSFSNLLAMDDQRGGPAAVDIAASTPLSDEQRLQIHERLRRQYLADDAKAGMDSTRVNPAPARISRLDRLRASLPSWTRPRVSLRAAQQP